MGSPAESLEAGAVLGPDHYVCTLPEEVCKVAKTLLGEEEQSRTAALLQMRHFVTTHPSITNCRMGECYECCMCVCVRACCVCVWVVCVASVAVGVCCVCLCGCVLHVCVSLALFSPVYCRFVVFRPIYVLFSYLLLPCLLPSPAVPSFSLLIPLFFSSTTTYSFSPFSFLFYSSFLFPFPLTFFLSQNQFHFSLVT